MNDFLDVVRTLALGYLQVFNRELIIQNGFVMEIAKWFCSLIWRGALKCGNTFAWLGINFFRDFF